MMKAKAYEHTLFAMHVDGALSLPHELVPYIDVDEVTEADWNAVQYNPPAKAPWSDPVPYDPNASPKPSWSAIVQYATPSAAALAADLRREARRRITAAYGARDPEEEVFLRLRAGHSAVQDAERDRLRAVYKAQKSAVQAMTPAERNAYNPSADSIWARPNAPKL